VISLPQYSAPVSRALCARHSVRLLCGHKFSWRLCGCSFHRHGCKRLQFLWDTEPAISRQPSARTPATRQTKNFSSRSQPPQPNPEPTPGTKFLFLECHVLDSGSETKAQNIAGLAWISLAELSTVIRL